MIEEFDTNVGKLFPEDASDVADSKVEVEMSTSKTTEPVTSSEAMEALRGLQDQKDRGAMSPEVYAKMKVPLVKSLHAAATTIAATQDDGMSDLVNDEALPDIKMKAVGHLDEMKKLLELKH